MSAKPLHKSSRHCGACIEANLPGLLSSKRTAAAIVCTLEDDSSRQTLQGPSGIRAAIDQINIWAETRREVMAVAREVLVALNGYRGAFKNIPVSGAFLDSMSRERNYDTGAFCVSMRFTIHYQEV